MKFLKYLYRFMFWTINRIFVIIFIRPIFGVVRIDKNEFPSPPFIIAANHGMFFDPWIIGSYCPYPLAIMMNEFGFKTNPFVRWYQKTSGAFPKKKGTSDYRALKMGLRQLSEGYPLLIFPEGQVTWDGETQPLFHGVEKMLKRLSIPIVLANLKGSFLCKPWWAKRYRKGKVRLSFEMISARALQHLSEVEILKKLEDFLYNNDIKEPVNKGTFIAGNELAKGLEHFLWICPNCVKENGLVTKDNLISCDFCACSWEIDAYCNLKALKIKNNEILDIYDWAQWHKKKVIEKLRKANSEELLLENSETENCAITKNGIVKILSKGRLSLTKTALSFTPEDNNFPQIKLYVKNICDYVFQKKDLLECRYDDQVYHFRFINCSTMKWIYYLRYINHFEVYEERKYI